MYLGDNFAVRFFKHFSLRQLVIENQSAGVVHTNFDPFKGVQSITLSDSAKKLRDVPNAGGSSVVSEVLSYELLQRCFGAALMKTEMEVQYYPVGGSITDYVCQMFGESLGVSVTRAMKFKGDFTEEDAQRLLCKKLNGVIQSSKNSLVRWSKQILHVWATNSDTANVVTSTYQHLCDSVKSNTVVLITVASYAPEIFSN